MYNFSMECINCSYFNGFQFLQMMSNFSLFCTLFQDTSIKENDLGTNRFSQVNDEVMEQTDSDEAKKWIENLRDQYKEKSSNPLVLKIQNYLKIDNLSLKEIEIVKILIERVEILSKLQLHGDKPMLTKLKQRRRRTKKVETQVRKSTRLRQVNMTNPIFAQSRVHDSYEGLRKKKSKVITSKSKGIASCLRYSTQGGVTPAKEYESKSDFVAKELMSEVPSKYEETNGQRKQESEHEVFESSKVGIEEELRRVDSSCSVIEGIEQGLDQKLKYHNGLIGSAYLEHGIGQEYVQDSADENPMVNEDKSSEERKVHQPKGDEESFSLPAEVTENIPDVENEEKQSDSVGGLQGNSSNYSKEEHGNKIDICLPIASDLTKIGREFENPDDSTLEFLDISSTMDDDDVRALNDDILDSREYDDAVCNVLADSHKCQSDTDRLKSTQDKDIEYQLVKSNFDSRTKICEKASGELPVLIPTIIMTGETAYEGDESEDVHKVHMGQEDKVYEQESKELVDNLTKPSSSSTPLSKKCRDSKETLIDRSQDLEYQGGSELAEDQVDKEFLNPTTPDTRTQEKRDLLRKLGMASSTPKFERQRISEEKVQRVSLSTHVWAVNTKGGVNFLHKFALSDGLLREIHSYCGPRSKFRLLSNITYEEFKCLWKNPMQSFGYRLGHFLTGFTNSGGVHEPNRDYCHFGHCQDGLF